MKLDSLQVLRGFAAVAVVYHHSLRAILINRPPSLSLPAGALVPTVPALELGAIGVDVFFILSGFLMMYISRPYVSGEKSAANFLLHRFIRIWPLYAIITAWKCMPLVYLYYKTGIVDFDLQPIRLASFLFITSFDRYDRLAPIMGIGWTLIYEMFFYLCFAACILISRRHILPLLAIIITAAFAVGVMLPAGSVAAVFLGKDIVFEFLMGAVLGANMKRLPLTATAGIAALGVGLLLLVVNGFNALDGVPRVIKYGIPALAIFYGMLALQSSITWPALLRKIGDASYSIYLVHLFFVAKCASVLLTPVARYFPPSTPVIVVALLATVVGIVAGIACYYCIERPVFRLAKRLVDRADRRVATPSLA